MKELEELKQLVRLKEVTRTGIVGDRKESSAEHTWACMVLADYFLKNVDQLIDNQKVMKLILYHDLVEIESGDVYVLDQSARKNKSDEEKKASKTLAIKLPKSISEEYLKYFEEFEAQETIEARFAKAIDKIEPTVHWSLWGFEKLRALGWTEEVARQRLEKYFKEFPEILNFWNDWLKYAKENNYF